MPLKVSLLSLKINSLNLILQISGTQFSHFALRIKLELDNGKEKT